MRARLAWLLLAASCQAGSYQPRFSPIDSDGRVLRDASGRALVLRGVNFKVEGVFDVTFSDGRAPRETVPAFDASDVAEMLRLGFNAVRLPINWSAFEPAPGQYSTAYLDRVAAVTALFRSSGIYVLIDLHEDGWSKELCEDGAPLWAIVPAPAMLPPGGPWWQNGDCHASSAALAAFNSFFADQPQLQERYISMLVEVAKRFRDDGAVLGYEIMNEPIGDDDAIAAFNVKAAQALRAADARHLIFFEPSAVRNFTNSTPPSARPFPVEGAVYAVHVYTPMTVSGLDASVLAARDEADAWRTPLVLTEAGAPDQGQFGHGWITTLLDATDSVGASLTYWLWKDGLHVQNPDGSWSQRAPIVSALVRPYAQAVGGDPAGATWDGRTLAVHFFGRADVKPVHSIFWNLAAPSLTCDGKPIAPLGSDAATSILTAACGGGGAHVLAAVLP